MSVASQKANLTSFKTAVGLLRDRYDDLIYIRWEPSSQAHNVVWKNKNGVKMKLQNKMQTTFKIKPFLNSKCVMVNMVFFFISLQYSTKNHLL